MPLERSLAEVFHTFHDAVRDDMRKCIPAVVVAVHPDRQTVDVQPTVQNVLFDEFGNASHESLPGLSDVPIGVMRGGGFFVWLPVAVGDSVLLVFSDLSTDTWRASNGQKPSQPGWSGKHTPDSPFAIPCIAPDASFFADPNADPGKVIIGKDGSQAQIRLSATEIELGATHGGNMALAAKIDSLINVIVATYTASGTETGFAALVAALATWKGLNWVASPTVGSSLVKAQ